MLSDEVFELVRKNPEDLSGRELVQVVLELNEPTKIPPCSVCGAELQVGAMGGGEPTRYSCSSPEADWMAKADKHGIGSKEKREAFRHRVNSEFVDRRQTDPWAYELAKRVKEEFL